MERNLFQARKDLLQFQMLRLKHFFEKCEDKSGIRIIGVIVKMRLEIIIKPQGLRLDPITRDKDCGNQRNTKF